MAQQRQQRVSGANSAAWLAAAAIYAASAAAAVGSAAWPLSQGAPLSAWRVLAADAGFAAGCTTFLASARAYGRHWHPDTAPYTAAWLDADDSSPSSHVVLPRGFASYLPLAGLLAFALPAAAAALLAWQSGFGAAAVLLGGYLLAFVPQMLLETRLFNRNPLSPVIPFTFAPYRFWQLARSLWALGSHKGAAAAAPDWAAPFLLALLAFWLFDFGVTGSQLPWVYNWQRQARQDDQGKAE